MNLNWIALLLTGLSLSCSFSSQKQVHSSANNLKILSNFIDVLNSENLVDSLFLHPNSDMNIDSCCAPLQTILSNYAEFSKEFEIPAREKIQKWKSNYIEEKFYIIIENCKIDTLRSIENCSFINYNVPIVVASDTFLTDIEVLSFDDREYLLSIDK